MPTGQTCADGTTCVCPKAKNLVKSTYHKPMSGCNMNKLEPMTVVKHFKGNQYLVLGVAEHTEFNTEFVVYRSLDGDRKLFVRPIDMFLSDVDKEKYPDVQQKERFEYVAPLKDILAAKATA